MSKSLGNYIGIHESAADMFGKLMSISDELMWRYFELLSQRTLMDIRVLRKSVEEGKNPRDAKFELAVEIVDTYHGRGAGAGEREKFIARFRDGALPDAIPEKVLASAGSAIKLANALKDAGLAASATAAYRLIDQGAVRVDGERVSDRDATLVAGSTYLLQAGKRAFARVSIQGS
jgi:tyrosyl-tRNA synthetase